nr:2TM domain-containing protein [uncultured Chryseobacterium sp.]
MNYSSAQQRMKDLKSFYTNCMWFGIVTIILFFRKFFRTGNLSESLFGISFILIIWAVILTVKAVKLFILNAEWENKILEEEIRKVK